MSELAHKLYLENRDRIVGVILTEHFFDRFLQRFNSFERLGIILSEINKKVPELIFDVELYGGTQRFHVNGCKVIVGVDKNLHYPRLVLKTIY